MSLSIWNCGVIVHMPSEHGDVLEACNYDYDQRFKMFPRFSFSLTRAMTLIFMYRTFKDCCLSYLRHLRSRIFHSRLLDI